MVFVDTGAWFALSVGSDPDHARAKHFVESNSDSLVTTDYIIDELLTLFIVRDEKRKGIEWIQDVLGPELDPIRIESRDIEAACHIYSQFADKTWSFTDCTSYVIMRRLRIVKAFSFDSHFHEFGFVHVVP